MAQVRLFLLQAQLQMAQVHLLMSFMFAALPAPVLQTQVLQPQLLCAQVLHAGVLRSVLPPRLLQFVVRLRAGLYLHLPKHALRLWLCVPLVPEALCSVLRCFAALCLVDEWSGAGLLGVPDAGHLDSLSTFIPHGPLQDPHEDYHLDLPADLQVPRQDSQASAESDQGQVQRVGGAFEGTGEAVADSHEYHPVASADCGVAVAGGCGHHPGAIQVCPQACCLLDHEVVEAR